MPAVNPISRIFRAAKSSRALLAAALIPLLSACTSQLVEVRMGSDSVAVLDANQVSACQDKGQINVSVLAEVGFITRSNDKVEGELLQLARNGAVTAGADSVVKGNSLEFGKRTYSMYKCR